MRCPGFRCALNASLLVLVPVSLPPIVQAQVTKETHATAVSHADADYVEQRAQWFLHGRVVPGKSTAELRTRAYQAKMQARAARARASGMHTTSNAQPQLAGGWTPLGPVPLASDATGDGFQNYNQVSGRATAVAIDPADPGGNTVYIGAAQGGVWKSTNAAGSVANSVMWFPISDDQATLSIGAIAIQPGNTNPANSVILVGTGEADNVADSYFGLGMLLSTNGGSTWQPIISTAGNDGSTVSFSGLGATKIAFSTANTNTVVAAMAATNEGIVEGALTSSTLRGLYTSTDAGETWTYDALFAGGASEATSATSVVYNAAAGLFFSALRYHGFYSSPDGLNWTRLTSQPGNSLALDLAACPQSYVTTCPIYRAEITVVPGRNEMYVWFISLDSNGNAVDQGIWQSLNSGVSWSPISDSGIINCADPGGCGVEQGFYNLTLLAVPDCPDGVQICTGNPTDLYAGAINLYKCSITSINPTCAAIPFLNLTHVYGCDPLGAPAHVHPDEHAMAFAIPNTGSSSATDLMYFATDGGIYRALDGFTGLTTGSCSGTNLFDDLNQNLGSTAQFVSFSQHPTNPDMLLGGTQGNGSPATVTAASSTAWGNVLSGDGGYNAIDANSGDWYASNPDTGLGTLNIQECSSGINCIDSLFNIVVDSGDVGGDDGAFYFPYILDPQSATTLLLGTCRVWSGPRLGGAFTLLSLNFDTLGIGTCAGTEVNVVRALAAGGPTNTNGSQVIYATTDGLGPNDLSTPIGGNVWVTTNATGVSGVASTFANVTLNGPGEQNINPNQFPISGVAIDTSDASGNTAYVTVMGFTGGPGHVWQTTNAGASWSDFSGSAANAIPDSPANAVVVDPIGHVVYVGTDVGVFKSPTSSPAWVEVGPIPNPEGGVAGFLPNVAVTALALFNSAGQSLLRASTYGRGVWQFNLQATPDFEIAVSNTPLTVYQGSPAVFDGTLTSENLYNNSVTLSCTGSALPTPCTPSPISLTPTSTGSAFLVTAGAETIADYNFDVQGVGTDPNNTTNMLPLTMHVVTLAVSGLTPGSVTEPRGATSPPVSFQVSSQGTFNESVTLSCGFSPSIAGATCVFTPGAAVNVATGSPVNMTASVVVPATTALGSYAATVQATSSVGPSPLTASFTITVIENPNFTLSEPTPFPLVNEGSTASGPISIAAQDGFAGTVNLACALASSSGSCSVSPNSISTYPATANVTVNAIGLTAGANQLTVTGTSGGDTQTLTISFNVADYTISGSQVLSASPGGQVTANLTLTSTLYSGLITATCNALSLPAAQCTLSPATVSLTSGSAGMVGALINVPNDAVPGPYNIIINTSDSSGEPNHAWTIVLTVNQDFVIGSLTPTTQTITPGESASYNFSVLPVGASFNGAVNLSCSGNPTNSLCNFTPNPVTPGASAAAVVLTITTSAGSTSMLPSGGPRIFYALCIFLPGLVILLFHAGGRLRMGIFVPASMLGILLFLILLPACGGIGINGGSTGISTQGTPPGTYSIIVTGTSGILSHQSPSLPPVTLVVSQ